MLCCCFFVEETQNHSFVSLYYIVYEYGVDAVLLFFLLRNHRITALLVCIY